MKRNSRIIPEMKRVGFLLALIALSASMSSCDTGLFKQMDAALGQVEENLGHVNTLDTRDVQKMAGWFARHGDDGQKGRALYCLGRNQLNDGNLPAAMVSYTMALECSVKAADSLRVARICYDLARACGVSCDQDSQMMYLKRSAESFTAVGYKNESLHALLEMGQVESEMGRYEAAEGIFKNILNDSRELKDTLLEVRCLESYAALAVSGDTPDPALAINLLDRASDELGSPLSCGDKGVLAYACAIAGNVSESKRWLSAAASSAETDAEMAEVIFREYQIALRAGDNKKAIAALKKVMDYDLHTCSAALSKVVSASRENFIQGKKMLDRENLKVDRQKIWLSALVALLVVVVAAVVYSLKKKLI